MVSVRQVIDVCDRCSFGKAPPATEQRLLAIDDVYYLLKVCATHANMFDRDLGVWTRLAEEVDPPADRRKKSIFFTEEMKAETRRIRDLTEKARESKARAAFVEERLEQIDTEGQQRALADAEAAWKSVPGAMNWTLSTHAQERAEERGFSLHDVFLAAATPKFTHAQPWRGADVYVHQYGICRIVVDAKRKVIMTVMDRDLAIETQPPARKQAQ